MAEAIYIIKHLVLDVKYSIKCIFYYTRFYLTVMCLTEDVLLFLITYYSLPKANNKELVMENYYI